MYQIYVASVYCEFRHCVYLLTRIFFKFLNSNNFWNAWNVWIFDTDFASDSITVNLEKKHAKN